MLVLPNGLGPKTTEPLNAREVAWLALAEDVCRKLNLTIACPRCLRNGMRTGAVLRGNNDSSDLTMSIACECRTLRFNKGT